MYGMKQKLEKDVKSFLHTSTERWKTDSWQRSIWKESEAYLQQMVVWAGRQSALSNGCISRHPQTNWASQEESPTDVRLVHSHPPGAQARWAEPKLNLLMLHWTSIMAGNWTCAVKIHQLCIQKVRFECLSAFFYGQGVRSCFEFRGFFSVKCDPAHSIVMQ